MNRGEGVDSEAKIPEKAQKELLFNTASESRLKMEGTYLLGAYLLAVFTSRTY